MEIHSLVVVLHQLYRLLTLYMLIIKLLCRYYLRRHGANHDTRKVSTLRSSQLPMVETLADRDRSIGSRHSVRGIIRSRKSQEILRDAQASSSSSSTIKTKPAISASNENTMAIKDPPRTSASSSRAGDTNPAERAPSPAAPKKDLGRPLKRPRLDASQESEPFYADSGILVPSFTAGTFQIYNWMYPPIKNFPDIIASRRVEKKRLEDAFRAVYFDDGSDDRSEFAMTLADDAHYGAGAMARSIASTCMNRAKKAHSIRKISWARFEDEELAIKTREYGLCGKSRLQVFNQIKERLCNEIFLEHYDPRRLAARQDSVMPIILPGAKEVIPDEEKEVAGWDGSAPILKGSEDADHAWGRRCSNCGTDRPNRLEDPKCPVCKTLEDQSWSIS